MPSYIWLPSKANIGKCLVSVTHLNYDAQIFNVVLLSLYQLIEDKPAMKPLQ